MRTVIGPDRTITSKRARRFVLRRTPAVLAVLLAVLMLSTACSHGSASSGSPTSEELEEALANGRPTLAGLVGDDCCQDIRPTLEVLVAEYDGTYNILIIEAGEQKGLFNRYGITLTPTQVYFDRNGEEVERIVGLSSKKQMVERLAGIGV